VASTNEQEDMTSA